MNTFRTMESSFDTKDLQAALYKIWGFYGIELLNTFPQ